MKYETPRTESVINAEYATHQARRLCLEEHARKLELELNEVTEWRDRWKACTEQATLVHEEISRVTGIKCLPSQMPRFLAERLAALPNDQAHPQPVAAVVERKAKYE